MSHRFLYSTLLTVCLGNCALGQGSWSNKIDWSDPNEMDEGIVKHYRAIHVALLPSGDILYWGWYSDNVGDNQHLRVRIAFKATNYTTTADARCVNTNIFCIGPSFLADGRLATFGGHWVENPGPPYGDEIIHGRIDTDIFNWNDFNPPNSYGWMPGPNMANAVRKPDGGCQWIASACGPVGDICRAINGKYCAGDGPTNCHCYSIPTKPKG